MSWKHMPPETRKRISKLASAARWSNKTKEERRAATLLARSHQDPEKTRLRLMVASHTPEANAKRSASMRARPKREYLRYTAAHSRLRKVLPRVCQFCGSTDDLQVALKHGDDQPGVQCDTVKRWRYSNDPAAYMRLCRPCHSEYDDPGHERFRSLSKHANDVRWGRA